MEKITIADRLSDITTRTKHLQELLEKENPCVDHDHAGPDGDFSGPDVNDTDR